MKIDFYGALKHLLPYGKIKEVCASIEVSPKGFPSRMRNARLDIACEVLSQLGYELWIVPKDKTDCECIALRDDKIETVGIHITDDDIVVYDDGGLVILE